MDRCPNCKARVGEAPTCRRCGMELGQLFETERAAERALVQGMRYLLEGERERAIHALSRSRALHDTPLPRELLGFLAVNDPSTSDSVRTADPTAASVGSAMRTRPLATGVQTASRPDWPLEDT
ncbi:hypothetical protein [Imhoffiella purpurea]|uniref:Uncharacterized protein n=1 Tax=Imhoffiella purpurea TaxID=1249627 RepID=W9VZB4_9GAMM|nr:hypothetical protein [Imhoffiella purpurea]EXJ15730.1 hypothetical protein D779_1118 [Imhoffiella purpurea]